MAVTGQGGGEHLRHEQLDRLQAFFVFCTVKPVFLSRGPMREISNIVE